jgi:hypothetical protein
VTDVVRSSLHHFALEFPNAPTDARFDLRCDFHGEVNNHLDNIRVSFRNPTQHPEAIYDIHEVQDLWSICVDVINRMVKILKDHGYA